MVDWTIDLDLALAGLTDWPRVCWWADWIFGLMIVGFIVEKEDTEQWKLRNGRFMDDLWTELFSVLGCIERFKIISLLHYTVLGRTF